MMHHILTAILIAIAAPAPAAQSGQPPAMAPMAGMASPQVPTDPKCPPEHAAMGHCTPAPAVTAPSQAAPADPKCPPEHAAMGHCTQAPNVSPAPPPRAEPVDPACPPEHAAMGHCTPRPAPSSPQLPAAGDPPRKGSPAAALRGPANAADAVWGADTMAPSRHAAYAEHGSMPVGKLLIDRLEYRAQKGRDGYAWEGEGWYGGDYDRLWIKSQGEGGFGGSLESAELQALWSHAIDPWFNLQGGVRYDVRPEPDRAHLALGVQGLAPYLFELDAALFLSDHGDLTARIEAEYDQRITNQLILQPRGEINISAQDVRAIGIGAGLSSVEGGVRLRYEFVPEFAPYIGVEYERSVGDTARFARAAGDSVGGWRFVTGVRAWF